MGSARRRELWRFGLVICTSLLLGAAIAAGQSIVFDPDGSPAASIPGPVDVASGEYDANTTPPALDIGGSLIRLGDADSPTSQPNGLGIKFTDMGDSHGTLLYDSNAEEFVLCESSGNNVLTCDSGSKTLRINVNTGEVTVVDGNLGVGTDPSYPVHISADDPAGDPHATMMVEETSDHGGIVINSPSGYQSHLRFQDAGTLKWQWRTGSNTDGDLNAYSWDLSNTVLSLHEENGNVEIPNGNLDMGGNDITNVGQIQSAGAGYDLQTWGGYTGSASGHQVFGPFSPSSGNSHYIEKIVYSEYHPHRYGQLRDGSGTPVVEAIDCDNWGTDGGERGGACTYEFPYPVEMTGQWDLRIVDYSDGNNRRLSLTAFGFEAPSGLYGGKQGWAAGDHINCGADSWCTVDTYTVPSGTTLHITGMAFSTRYTYSIVRIEDGSGTNLVEGVTLGDHDWGNTRVEFGRAKTVGAGTDVRLRVYNDDSSSRDVKAMMWGYTEQ